MHSRSDPGDYNRGYEWWLMKEARRRNPEIKLYGLPWCFPGWLNPNATADSPSGSPIGAFSDPNATANYTLKWLLGAKCEHGLDIDHIGQCAERGGVGDRRGWGEGPDQRSGRREKPSSRVLRLAHCASTSRASAMPPLVEGVPRVRDATGSARTGQWNERDAPPAHAESLAQRVADAGLRTVCLGRLPHYPGSGDAPDGQNCTQFA